MAGSVDGLISGLDTSGIITQLMQLERLPVTRLEQKRTNTLAVATAYQTVNSKFATLQAAADKLTKADFWQGRTAVSSSTNVAATATSGALAGSFTFDVKEVATAWSYVSAAQYSSTSAPATGAAGLLITKGDGDPVAVDVGDGSLAAVVSGINGAKAGVRAAATQVSPGVYRLQLTSTTTGADSGFTITDDLGVADPLGVVNTLTTGRDASVSVGEAGSPGQYFVTSPTNTIADIMPGVTLTVKAKEDGVTVDVTADVRTIANQVESMVTAANGVLSEIKKLTAYDPATKKGGILVGDSTVRALQQEVLRLTSSSVGSSAAAGIELDRNGQLTFNKTKFESAYADDPVAVERLFGPTGSVSHPEGGTDPAAAALASSVSLFYADDRTVRGSYEVKVTAAATRANATVTGVPAINDTVTVKVAGKADVVVTATTADPADLAAQINQRSAEDSLGLVALVEGGSLVVRTTNYGSKPTFTLEATGSLVAGATVAGTDVAGTINGIVAAGEGQVLSAPLADTTLRGLSLLVKATPDQVTAADARVDALKNVFGTFTYAPGLAQRLDSYAGDAIRSGDGRLTSAIAGTDVLSKALEKEIESWEPRLALREKALRRQYSNLEVALGKLREQSSWLAGQLGSLSGNNG